MALPYDAHSPICYCSACPGRWDDPDGAEAEVECNCKCHQDVLDKSNRHGELKYRQLRGDALTVEEAQELSDLEKWLDDFLPKPQMLPQHIRDEIDEILRCKRGTAEDDRPGDSVQSS